MVAAVFSPVAENWRDHPSDGFPLSYYPMFSRQRGEVYRQTHLVGVDAENNRILIPYRFAGAGGFNQVRRQINRPPDLLLPLGWIGITAAWRPLPLQPSSD